MKITDIAKKKEGAYALFVNNSDIVDRVMYFRIQHTLNTVRYRTSSPEFLVYYDVGDYLHQQRAKS